MAAPKRDYGEGCREENSGIFLRGLFPGPWGHGGRLEQLERSVGNGSNLCFIGGMGRPRHQRIEPVHNLEAAGRILGHISPAGTERMVFCPE